MKRVLVVLLAGLQACITPKTQARILFNPTTGQIEGEINRAWLAGPVNMIATYRDKDGRSFEFIWTSEVDLEASSRASQAQSRMIQDAFQATAETLKQGWFQL